MNSCANAAISAGSSILQEKSHCWGHSPASFQPEGCGDQSRKAADVEREGLRWMCWNNVGDERHFWKARSTFDACGWREVEISTRLD